MKNLKSVAVAVVLGSLLCSGGLAVAASSTWHKYPTKSIIILNNTNLGLFLQQDDNDLKTDGSSKCSATSNSCKYTITPSSTSTSTYTVTPADSRVKAIELQIDTSKLLVRVNCTVKESVLNCSQEQ